MTIIRTAVALVVLASCARCAEAPAQRAPQPRWPFKVSVDAARGYEGGLPVRFQQQSTGIWFVLVPGGKYTIGSAEFADSAPIEVTMSPFYIAERLASQQQVASMLSRVLGKSVQDAPPERWNDELRLKWLTEFSFASIGWPAAFDSDSKQAAVELLLEVAQGTGDARTLAELKLTQEQRSAIASLEKSAREQLDRLRQRGDAPLTETSFANAEEFAEAYRVAIPTEAQWEVAASLVEAGKLNVEDLVNPGAVRQWCSDHYAFDYYRRKDQLHDPRGPRHGKCSPRQLEEETPDSGLKIATRLFVRSLRVVRGGSVSKRMYRRPGLGADRGIRLVFVPERRVAADE